MGRNRDVSRLESWTLSLRGPLATTVAFLSLAGAISSTALTAPGGASTPPTKAQAIAFARAVNLKVGELPGAKALPEGVERPREDPAKRELQCGSHGKPLSHPLFDEASGLVAPYGLVGSTVVVMQSEALAEALSAALASRRASTCLSRSLGAGVSVEGEKTVRSHAVQVKLVSLAPTLGPGAFAIHVLAVLPPIKLPPSLRHELKKPLPKPKATVTHIDAAFFRVGPAEIMLFRLGPKPFPSAEESQALSVLYTHAQENKL
jgi:hypothetical protein